MQPHRDFVRAPFVRKALKVGFSCSRCNEQFLSSCVNNESGLVPLLTDTHAALRILQLTPITPRAIPPMVKLSAVGDIQGRAANKLVMCLADKSKGSDLLPEAFDYWLEWELRHCFRA